MDATSPLTKNLEISVKMGKLNAHMGSSMILV